jgi:hypothetical protein
MRKQGQTTFFLAAVAFLLAACGGGQVPPDWQMNALGALSSFQQRYLRGETAAAEAEFVRAKNELRATGRGDLLARAELIRCAVRTASLEIDDCPAFEKLRADAGAEELAYVDFLSGKSERKGTEDALSRLVSYGVQFKSDKATPDGIAAAVELSSQQGWRRPLLAWLGVQEKRAEAAGDRAAAERVRRRIELVLGKS